MHNLLGGYFSQLSAAANTMPFYRFTGGSAVNTLSSVNHMKESLQCEYFFSCYKAQTSHLALLYIYSSLYLFVGWYSCTQISILKT